MVHATPKCNIYNFDKYVPITVILLFLSNNSLPQSVMVLLEILIKREVRKLEHSSDGCVEKGNARKKTMFIETGIHFRVIKP